MRKASIILIAILIGGFSQAETIAISYFDNTSGITKYNSLSKGIADMLITDLSKIDGISIVEREKLEKLLHEIKLGQSKYFDPSTAQKLGKGLGAKSILTGSFYFIDNTMRIDARLINVENGAIILAEQVTGSQSDFFSLHRKLATLLTKQIKINYFPEKNGFYTEANPVDLISVVNYSAAIDLQDQGFTSLAQNKLTELVEQAPQFLFAKNKLNEIRAWLKEQDALLERKQQEELNTVINSINPKNPNFLSQLDFVWRRLDDKNQCTQLLAFNQWVRKLKLNPNLKIAPSQELEESLLFYDGRALYSLCRYEEFLEQSKSIIIKYPESSMTRNIKFLLENAIEELEKREKGKKDLEFFLAQPIAEVYANHLPRVLSSPSDFLNEDEYQYYLSIFNDKILSRDRREIGEPLIGGSVGLISKIFKLSLYFNDQATAKKVIEKCKEVARGERSEYEIGRLEENLKDFQSDLVDEQKKIDELKKLGESGTAGEINSRFSFLWSPFIKNYVPYKLYQNLCERFISIYESSRYPLKKSSDLFRVWKKYIVFTAKQKSITAANELLKRMKQDFASKSYHLEFKESILDLEEALKKIEKDYNEYVNNRKLFNPDKEILEKQIGILYKNRQQEKQIDFLQRMLTDFDLSDDEKIDYQDDLYLAYTQIGKFSEARAIVKQLNTNYPTHETTIELVKGSNDLPY
jgi:TolB-like protein